MKNIVYALFLFQFVLFLRFRIINMCVSPRTFLSKTLASSFRNISRRKYAQQYNAIKETSDIKFLSPSFRLATQWPEKIAITDQHGDYSYRNVVSGSKILANTLTESLEEKVQERVAFLCQNDASYVMMLWACWMTGQIGKLEVKFYTTEKKYYSFI